MRKTPQQLAEQVAFLLRTENPLYDTHASIEAVMNELETILPGRYDLSDLIVQESIRLLAQRGRLAQSPEVLRNIAELKRNHPEFNFHTANVLLIVNYGNDLSEAGLEYALSQVADQLERSPEYKAQIAANDKAQRDIAEAEEIRAWALDLFQTNKKAAFLKNSGGNHMAWNLELAKAVKKFAAMDIEQLRALKAQYATKAELSAQAESSIAQLKEARQKDTVQVGGKNEFPMFPRLPEYFYQGLTKIPYNRDTLTQISKLDAEFFRGLAKKYGHEALAERMRGDQ